LAVLYRHIRLDKNVPFYVGIGDSEKRAYNKINRTKIWKNIAKKGYEVEILFEDLTWEQAIEKEKEFIALYGRRDLGLGPLVNLTDGGEGTIGYRHSDEVKEKCRLIPTGRKHTEEEKRKISEANRGERNPCYGRTGDKNPLYGKPGYWQDKASPKRVKVEYENMEFESQTALAKYLKKSKAYVTKLVKKQLVKTIK
jgi:biotin operon repressor